jgi:hypothetical protein
VTLPRERMYQLCLSCMSTSAPPANQTLGFSVVLDQDRFPVSRRKLLRNPLTWTIPLWLLSEQTGQKIAVPPHSSGGSRRM